MMIDRVRFLSWIKKKKKKKKKQKHSSCTNTIEKAMMRECRVVLPSLLPFGIFKKMYEGSLVVLNLKCNFIYFFFL